MKNRREGSFDNISMIDKDNVTQGEIKLCNINKIKIVKKSVKPQFINNDKRLIQLHNMMMRAKRRWTKQ